MPKERSRHRSPSRDRKKKRRSRSRTRDDDRRDESTKNKHSKESRDEKTHSRQREFSFEDYKRDLDLLFFTDRDVIKKDTTQYDEFWKFFAKYQSMRKRQGINTWTAPRSQPSNELGLPLTYHRTFQLNFGLNLPSPDKLLCRLPPHDPDNRSSRPRLTRENLMECEFIVLFLDAIFNDVFNYLHLNSPPDHSSLSGISTA